MHSENKIINIAENLNEAENKVYHFDVELDYFVGYYHDECEKQADLNFPFSHLIIHEMMTLERCILMMLFRERVIVVVVLLS